MNIAIDIGNTRTKVGVFEGTSLTESLILENTNQLALLIDKYPVKSIIVSSVVTNSNFLSVIPKKCNLLNLTHTTPIPIKNNYQTQATLGNDRLIAAIGAFSLFPNSNTLVVDAGTCIKYNFTNSNNEYLGGGISPGLQMRLKALHTFTQKLPLVEMDYNYTMLIGNTTANSILSGVMTAALLEVDSFISEYKQNRSSLNVVLTGGDTPFFEKRLKNNIFASPNLNLIGLNTILQYNNNERYS